MKRKRLLAGITFMCAFSFSNAQDILNEKSYIKAEGIEQWITIKGADRSSPAILILHGGPGSPISPFSEAIFRDWEKDFIMVNWDQRGTGKTFGRNSPSEVDEEYLLTHPLDLEQMTADGIAVSEYLCKYLGKKKIILFGTSWGSLLGVNMASKRPDLFYAYLGHSQLVQPAADIIQVYHKTHQIALERKDSTGVEILHSLGPPPYHQAKHLGQLLRVIKKYEQESAIPAPAFWWEIHPEYDNERDETHRYQGDDYSFIYYAGHQPLGIPGMIHATNLTNNKTHFEIPIYLIQGEKDLLTPLDITTPYFEQIEAPDKKLFVVPEAAHGFNQAVIDTAYAILSTKVLPAIRAID